MNKLEILFTPELKRLAELFDENHFELKLVGGAVRDLLIGKVPHDFDFATTATPKEMREMFEKNEIRTINNKGEKHGTVTCRINETNFEITCLRIDAKTDGRHADIEFTRDWRLDAERRDFTINAMFLDFDGTIHDYFDGQKDLREKRIIFVGDAMTRILQDYLRILRYFRFVGQISDDPNLHDEATLKAIKENARGLERISGERIWTEMSKILIGRHANVVIRIMHQLGITKCIGFPSCLNLVQFDEICESNWDFQPTTLTVALLNSHKEFYSLVRRMKMSKDELKLGLFIITHRHAHISFDWIQNILFNSKIDKTKIHVIELLKYFNEKNLVQKMLNWTLPKFPVSGNSLVERGITGPNISKWIEFLRCKWKESHFTLDEMNLLKFIEI